MRQKDVVLFKCTHCVGVESLHVCDKSDYINGLIHMQC